MNLDELTNAQLRRLMRYLVERFDAASARNYLLFCERGKLAKEPTQRDRVYNAIRGCGRLVTYPVARGEFFDRTFYLDVLAYDLRHVGVTPLDLQRLFHEKTL